MRELTPEEIRRSEDERRARANAEYERLCAERDAAELAREQTGR